MGEETSRTWAALLHDAVRAEVLRAFADWAPELTRLFVEGDLLAVRPLYALPIGLHWTPRPGVTLIGDAAHLMSSFSGEDVNLALADAVDLAEALASVDSDAVAAF